MTKDTKQMGNFFAILSWIFFIPVLIISSIAMFFAYPFFIISVYFEEKKVEHKSNR